MDILVERDVNKIRSLIRSIEKQPKEQQSLFIPGGLKIYDIDDKVYPTEGTLSKNEIGTDRYFVLILRNEKERIEAEQKIKTISVEAEYLREEIRNLGNYDQIIGESKPLIQVLKKVGQVSKTDATVLVYGETGTGKEAIARAIHTSSNRNSKPLITVNCAAIPANLIESEFFGHEKGAFTGATTKRQGRFSLANKGTIFLDEISELPTDIQSKLLRVLQEGEFEPLGATQNIRVDVRIIAATNRNLKLEINHGNFWEDLYYRLNVFPIELPTLRERGEDIVKLAAYFLMKFSKRMGRTFKPFGEQDIEILNSYHWPGNVRELQNVIDRAVIISNGGQIDLKAIMPVETLKKPPDQPIEISKSPNKLLTEKEIIQIERENLIEALETTGWRVSGKKGAARPVGMNPSTFVSRMKKFQINRPGT